MLCSFRACWTVGRVILNHSVRCGVVLFARCSSTGSGMSLMRSLWGSGSASKCRARTLLSMSRRCCGDSVSGSGGLSCVFRLVHAL